MGGTKGKQVITHMTIRPPPRNWSPGGVVGTHPEPRGTPSKLDLKGEQNLSGKDLVREEAEESSQAEGTALGGEEDAWSRLQRGLIRGAFKFLKKQTRTLLPLPRPRSALSLEDTGGQVPSHLASSLQSPGDRVTSPAAASVGWSTSFLIGPHQPQRCGLVLLPFLPSCMPSLGILALLSVSFPFSSLELQVTGAKVAPCGLISPDCSGGGRVTDRSHGQKGARAPSACLHACQDAGACSLLREGKWCLRLFMI